MSFDECLSVPENPKQTACDFHFKNRILQLTYFCGSALLCQQGGNFDVIQRSKYNVEAYFSVVGMSHDLKRSFELLEALLPAFFSGAASIFQEDLKFNGNNSHSTVKNETYDVLIKIPAIQGELEFYSFLKQRFEQQYENFIGGK